MNPGIRRKRPGEVDCCNIVSRRNQKRYFVHSVFRLGAQWCNHGLVAAQIDYIALGIKLYIVNMSTYLLNAIFVRKKGPALGAKIDTAFGRKPWMQWAARLIQQDQCRYSTLRTWVTGER